jgi:hypothetical protein
MWKARALTLEELLKGSDISLPRSFSGGFWSGGKREARVHVFRVHLIADPSMALPTYEVIGGVGGCVGLFANMPNAAKHTKSGQVVPLIEHGKDTIPPSQTFPVWRLLMGVAGLLCM